MGHIPPRTSCLRCRTRKQKCDNAKPVCTRCFKSGADCEYVEGHEHNASRYDESDDEGEQLIYDSDETFPPVPSEPQNSAPFDMISLNQAHIEAASKYLYQNPVKLPNEYTALVPSASIMNPVLLRMLEVTENNFLCMWPEHKFQDHSAALYFSILTSGTFNPDPNSNIEDLLCAFEHASMFARSMAILDLPRAEEVIFAANTLREIIVDRQEELSTLTHYKKLIVPLTALAITAFEFTIIKNKFDLSFFFKCLQQALSLVKSSGEHEATLRESSETIEMLMLFPNGPCDIEAMEKMVGQIKLDCFLTFQKIRTYMYLLTYSGMQILADIFMPISEWQPGRPLQEVPLVPSVVQFASIVHEKYTHLCDYINRPDNIYLRPHFRALDMLQDGAAGYMAIIAIRLGLVNAVALHDISMVAKHLQMNYKDKWRTLSLSYGLIVQATYILEPELFARRLLAMNEFDDAFTELVRRKLTQLGEESGLVTSYNRGVKSADKPN